MLTLPEIQSEVELLAKKIDAPENLLPTYGYSRDGAYPHIEVSAKLYHYVIVERGQERERMKTKDFNQLLFWIFKSITFSMACDFELKNRIEDQDFRIILFAKQKELLSILSTDWAEKTVSSI